MPKRSKWSTYGLTWKEEKRERKHPPPVTVLPPNTPSDKPFHSTKHTKKFLGQISDWKFHQAKKGVMETQGRNDLNILERGFKRELEQSIKRGKHALAVPIADRFEIRHKLKKGAKVTELAKEYSTSPSLIRNIRDMREEVSEERKEMFGRHFFLLSDQLEKLLQSIDIEKRVNASFSQQMLGVGILSDKIAAIRKGLDGEAPRQLEVRGSLPSFADRSQLLEAVRQKLLDLKPLVADYEVLEEEKSEEGQKRLPSPQLDLFGSDT